MQHPYAGYALRYYGCKRGARNAHIKHKYEQRIKHDVSNRAYKHGIHAYFCKALRRYESVHAKRQLHEYGADSIYIHVIHGVAYRVFACAEGQQQIAVPYKQHRRKHHRYAKLQRKAAAEYRAHVSYVDPVHNVIEHVHKLRRYRGHGQLQKQLADRLRPEKCFILLHR